MKHGQSRKGHESGAYSSWVRMKNRCANRNEKSYSRYGGIGISVCERWLCFDAFYSDMGDRPEGRSLDRINVLGNYEPGNCRWATRSEQQNNKRATVKIDCFGKSLTAAEWGQALGLNSWAIIRRVKKGIPPEIALTAPMLRGKPLPRLAAIAKENGNA